MLARDCGVILLNQQHANNINKNKACICIVYIIKLSFCVSARLMKHITCMYILYIWKSFKKLLAYVSMYTK